MSINIIGTLLAPLGDIAPNTPVKIVAKEGSFAQLPYATSEFVTDSEGKYDVNLEYGHFDIWVKFTDTFEYMGYCIVNEGSPTPMTLEQLLEYTQPIPPDQVNYLDEKWKNEFDTLKNAFDTEMRQIRDQVVDGDTYVSETMTTYTNDRLGAQLAELNQTIAAETAKVLNQATAYSDALGNQYAEDITALQTDNASIKAVMTANQTETGAALAQIREDMTAGEANVTQLAKAYADALTGTLEASITQALNAGDDALAQQLQLTKDSLGNVLAQWQIVATVDELTSIIGMVNDGLTSHIYMVADKLSFTSTVGGQAITPFKVQGDKVYATSLVLGDGSEVDYGNVVGDKPPSNATHGATQEQIDAIINAQNTADQALLDLANEVGRIDADLVQKALNIANVDGKVDAEEQARIAAILAEEQSRVAAINARIAAEALLDGKITAEEAARIQLGTDLEVAYKNYTDTVRQALVDGEITAAEAAAIAEAQRQLDLAKAALQANIDGVANDLAAVRLDLNAVSADVVQQQLDLAALDGKVDASEAGLIQQVLDEQAARIAAINARIAEDAALDGKITAEETARIQLGTDLTTAYQNYTDTVRQALIDGEITAAEAAAIAEAQRQVDAAKAALQANIDQVVLDLNEVAQDLAAVSTDVAAHALALANLDGKIDTSEAELLQAILDEETARIADIAARIQAEAALDGKITAEEANRIQLGTDLTTAYQNYADTMRQALIDGEISAAEAAAIAEAQRQVDAAKAALEASISDLSLDLENFVEQTYAGDLANLQNQLDGKVETWVQASTAPLPDLNWTAAEKALHDGDLLYFRDTKKLFTYNSETGSWDTVDNQDAIDALENAAMAQATADGKVTTYYQDTAPANPSTGDLWVNTASNNRIFRWSGYLWELSNEVDMLQAKTDTIAAIADAIRAQSTADGKIETFFQATAPATGSEGDIWFDTDDGNKQYVWHNGSWVIAQDTAIGDAIAAATTAQATADGKVTTYSQPTAPVAEGIGDLWIDTDDSNRLYRWNGSSWVDLRDAGIAAALAAANTVANDLALAVDDINNALSVLQSQVDGAIETWFYDEDPTLLNEPAVNWTDDATKDVHISDLYYNNVTGYAYRFVKINGVYSWQQIPDTDVAKALQAAAQAQDTADSKRRVFVAQPNPPYDVGDLWAQGSGGELKMAVIARLVGAQFQAADWEPATGYQAALDQLNLDLVQAQLDIATADGKIDATEAALTSQILQETADRISAINLRIAAEAALDGKITTEEQARINQGLALEAAYKTYVATVRQAMVDGEISEAEATAIATAQAALDEAKAALEASLSDLSDELDALDTRVIANALQISNVDGRVSAEEAARIAAILAESTARASDMAERVAAEAALDGKITAEEQARIQSAADLTTAYKEYSRIVTLAIADGQLTPEEQALITDAQLAVDQAKARFESLETKDTQLAADIAQLDTTATAHALELAALDGKISDEEAARIAAIAAEEAARIQAITDRINAEALLDGKISAEEAERIKLGNDLTAAYTAYVNTVKQALVDGEISDAEANAIATAQAALDAAKLALQANIDALGTQVSALSTEQAAQALQLAAVDGKIDTTEAALVQQILDEGTARAQDIAARIAAEATLDGKITAEEAARIQLGTDLTTAYKAYTDTVKQALIDGEISQAEADAIAAAEAKVNAAKAALQLQLDALNTQVAGIDTTVGQQELELAALDGKIDAAETSLIQQILDEEQARITAINARIAADAALDGKITAEEAARIKLGTDLTAAYQTYVNTVKQALIDGEISDAEAAAIATAQAALDAAKTALQDQLDTLAGQVSGLDTTVAAQALAIAAVDGKVDAAEATLVQSILDEEAARIAAINARIAADAALDGRITDEEAARAQLGVDLTSAYKMYTDTVKQALIDGEISAAEANAIAQAQAKVDAAKAALEADITGVQNNLDNFVDNVYASDLNNLKNQVDGKVDTWVQLSTDPDPKLAWITPDQKLAHNGDVLFYTDNAQMFVYEAASHSWKPVKDPQMVEALAAAAEAKEAADGKVTTFYQSTVPTPEGTGDIWVDASNDNEPKRWNGTQWVSIRDTSVNEALSQANAALAAANEAIEAADGKIASFFQATAPTTGMSLGDIWFDTSDGNTQYRWDGSIWKSVQDTSIGDAIEAAQTAQTIADGKVDTFYQDSEPTGAKEGDLWVHTGDNLRLYRYTLGLWDSLQTLEIIISKDNALKALADAVKAQATADGKIETYFQDEMPTGGSEGDIWFDTNEGNKQYVYKAGEWVVAQDTAIGDAILAASDAQATADGKVTTFYQDTAPVAEGVGDLWVHTGLGNRLYRWTGTAWKDIQDSAIQDALNDAAQALQDAANAQATADGKIDSFFQPTAPASASEGDIWFDTDDGNKQHVYKNNQWVVAQDTKIGEAILAAAGAQATADGKITTFYQDNQPTAKALGDLWIDTNDGNRLYRWNGTTWKDVQDTRIASISNQLANAVARISDVEAVADGKVDVFYSSTTPSNPKYGDLWFNTGTGNSLKRWTGSQWTSLQDSQVQKAIQDAADAKAAADGKITTYYQESKPTLPDEGDLWIKTSTKEIFRYNSTYDRWDSVGEKVDYEDDRINNDKLTKEQVVGAGLYPNQSNLSIQSGNYALGSTGWAIDNVGNAEFNNATVRGVVYAYGGHFAGTLGVGSNFAVNASGHLTARSIDLGGSSGSRMQITSDRLEVYEGSTLRVRIGRL